MWKPQAGFGVPQPLLSPSPRDLKLCRVTSTADFVKTRRIEVLTADGSAPNPALVMAPGIICPYKQNDRVIVGFIDSVKDNPIVLGSVNGWGPVLGLMDFTIWDPQTQTLTLKHPTSGAKIVFEANGNIRIQAGPGGTVTTTNGY